VAQDIRRRGERRRDRDWMIVEAIGIGVTANPVLRRILGPSPPEAEDGTRATGSGLPGKKETDVSGHSSRILQHLSPEVKKTVA